MLPVPVVVNHRKSTSAHIAEAEALHHVHGEHSIRKFQKIMQQLHLGGLESVNEDALKQHSISHVITTQQEDPQFNSNGSWKHEFFSLQDDSTTDLLTVLPSILKRIWSLRIESPANNCLVHW